MERRARRDQQRADADAEFAMMQDDRARLAVELDAALDAQRALAEANAAAMERISRAAGTIERLLGRAALSARAWRRGDGMPQALVNIGGRSYRLACNPGEEPHLEALAKFVDGKIDEMRSARFGEIGDQRIVVMAALSIADELFEARRKAEARDGGDRGRRWTRRSASRAAAEARAAEPCRRARSTRCSRRSKP